MFCAIPALVPAKIFFENLYFASEDIHISGMKNEFNVSSLDQEILRRAKSGSADDVRTALVSAVVALNRVGHTSPYLLYLLECLQRILDGTDPSQVFNIVHHKSPGVKARSSDEELMATDIYLRLYLGFPPERSVEKVLELFNLADRRKIQRLRKKYDGAYSDSADQLMESQSSDDLLAEMSLSTKSKLSAISRELKLVDFYLQRYLNFPAQESTGKVLELFGFIDRQQVQRVRKEYEDKYLDFGEIALGDWSADELLDGMTASMRCNLLAIDPHTP